MSNNVIKYFQIISVFMVGLANAQETKEMNILFGCPFYHKWNFSENKPYESLWGIVGLEVGASINTKETENSILLMASTSTTDPFEFATPDTLKKIAQVAISIEQSKILGLVFDKYFTTKIMYGVRASGTWAGAYAFAYSDVDSLRMSSQKQVGYNEKKIYSLQPIIGLGFGNNLTLAIEYIPTFWGFDNGNLRQILIHEFMISIRASRKIAKKLN